MGAMDHFYKQFCTESFDENGVLSDFSINCPPNFNFAYDVVDAIADSRPDKLALVWCSASGGDTRRFTFSALKECSNRAANVFASHGIGRGDKVMLILKRHYEYWYAILALHKLGAVAVPATHMLTVKDIVYRTQSADIKAVICTPDGQVADHVRAAQLDCPSLEKLFIVRQAREGFFNFSEETARADTEFKRAATEAADPMLLYFTSGTTGYPKGVVHDFSYPLCHIITAKYWQNVVPGGLHLTLAETGWAKASWGKLYGQWLAGTAVMVYDFDKFVPDELLRVIEKYRVTTFCAPPTVYRFLVKSDIGTYDLSALVCTTNAGEALNPEIFKQFYEKTGLRLIEGYGQTETTLLIANLAGSHEKVGSMGKPSPLYDVVLLDESGNISAPGSTGEIVVRPRRAGRQFGVFNGYHSDSALYEAAWRGGVYHTGDTAYVDEEGYYWYVGRKDDIIKSSGYRIGPFEIESVLMEHPAVLECAVTGVPDEKRGQLVKASIVLSAGYKATKKLAEELQAYVKNVTAPYKYPRLISFVERLPKTISGKIRRVDIREKDQSGKFVADLSVSEKYKPVTAGS